MPEDRNEAAQPLARRAPPRDVPWLRGVARAAENGYATRRVAPAQASNDGNLAADGGAQGAQAAPQPRHPSASNDGNSARPAPQVRERRLPADPGRIPVAQTGRPGSLPSRPPGAPPRTSEASGQDGGRAAPGAQTRVAGFPSRPAARPAEPRLDAEGQPTSFGPDGSFLGLERDEDAPAPSRRVPPSGVPVADIDHGAPAFEEDDEARELDALSGQTHDDAGAAAKPAPGPSSRLLDIDMEEAFPEAEARPRAAGDGPGTPDLDRLRLIAHALDQRRARKRRDKDDEPAAPAPGQSAATEGSRMSDLLQKSDTHAKYLARGRQLLKRYKRESAIQLADEDVDPREFAVWLKSLRPFLSGSTWRIYRLSASAVVQTIPHAGLDEALIILSEDGRVVKEDAMPVYAQTLKKEGGATSAARAKRMDFVHYRKLRSSLRQMSRASAVDWLDDWLVAGINTGLRPGEWPLTQIVTARPASGSGRGKVWLHVVNAKQTHGRANGTYRTLDISDYRDETLEAIGRMVKRAQTWAMEGKFVQRQSDCAQLFYQLCAVLFPRMQMKYSLYSLRHQFIANMKAVYPDAAMVATLIGHISVETQVEHYGKRRSSWNRMDIKDIPVPLEEQTEQIRKHLSLLEAREHVRLMRKVYLEGRELGEEGEDDFGPEPETGIELVHEDDAGTKPDAADASSRTEA